MRRDATRLASFPKLDIFASFLLSVFSFIGVSVISRGYFAPLYYLRSIRLEFIWQLSNDKFWKSRRYILLFLSGITNFFMEHSWLEFLKLNVYLYLGMYILTLREWKKEF